MTKFKYEEDDAPPSLKNTNQNTRKKGKKTR
jgi:hypothetical protein